LRELSTYPKKRKKRLKVEEDIDRELEREDTQPSPQHFSDQSFGSRIHFYTGGLLFLTSIEEFNER
jgi:hypothetical protein